MTDQGGKRMEITVRQTSQETLEIEGNVDQTTGSLEHSGDIRIYGNVLGGVTIRAHGSVFVDGVVRGAKIKADHDVFVVQGIHGDRTGIVEAGGDVCTTFINHGTVAAGGDVQIDYAVASAIEAGGVVRATGRYGAIAGGVTEAFGGLEADVLGNSSGTTTRLYVGVSDKLIQELDNLRRQERGLQFELELGLSKADPMIQSETLRQVRSLIRGLEIKKRDCADVMVVVYGAVFEGVECEVNQVPAAGLPGKRAVRLGSRYGRVMYTPIGEATYVGAQKSKTITSTRGAGELPKVLIVDGDAKMLSQAKDALAGSVQVFTAETGNAAQLFLQKQEVDLILLEYMLPDENGIRALSKLRKGETTKHIPVAFFSALTDQKRITDCLALNPAGYISKAVNAQTLRGQVQSILQKEGKL